MHSIRDQRSTFSTQSELFDLMFTASPWFIQLSSALQRTGQRSKIKDQKSDFPHFQPTPNCLSSTLVSQGRMLCACGCSLIIRRLGYVASDWVVSEDVKQRTCTYTMALNYAMAPKSCAATEKQVYGSVRGVGRRFPPHHEPHHAQVSKAFPGGFTVVKDTVSSGVPYADSFHVSCTYCVMGYGRGQVRRRRLLIEEKIDIFEHDDVS